MARPIPITRLNDRSRAYRNKANKNNSTSTTFLELRNYIHILENKTDRKCLSHGIFLTADVLAYDSSSQQTQAAEPQSKAGTCSVLILEVGVMPHHKYRSIVEKTVSIVSTAACSLFN